MTYPPHRLTQTTYSVDTRVEVEPPHDVVICMLMGNRKTAFSPGEYFHCFNRGVDKRIVFSSPDEFEYFLDALNLFNREESLGDMRHYKINIDEDGGDQNKQEIVSLIAYCLNLNHFHLLVRPETNDGLTKFMQKISTGYTMYFNKKNNRSGALFQGRFKAVHVENDIQLKHLFAYVTKNNLVHNISDPAKYKSSYTEIVNSKPNEICNKELVSSLFGSEQKIITTIKSGIQHTIEYRKNLSNSEKSEFLE